MTVTKAQQHVEGWIIIGDLLPGLAEGEPRLISGSGCPWQSLSGTERMGSRGGVRQNLAARFVTKCYLLT